MEKIGNPWCRAKVKNMWNCVSMSFISPHGVVVGHGDNFILTATGTSSLNWRTDCKLIRVIWPLFLILWRKMVWLYHCVWECVCLPFEPVNRFSLNMKIGELCRIDAKYWHHVPRSMIILFLRGLCWFNLDRWLRIGLSDEPLRQLWTC